MWANPTPVFPIIPVDSIVPTGAGLGSEWHVETTPSPFALGPVPALQTHIPNPKYRFPKAGAKTAPTTSKPTTTKPSTSKPSTSRSTSGPSSTRTRSQSRSGSSRPGPSRPVPPPAPAVPTLVLAPVVVQGVPGSTAVGVDTVSDVQHSKF